MNNNEPWWYRLLAHSSPNLFWAIWGVVVGACIGVFAAAADVRGDILRIYLAVVTAIGGGFLGIYGARAMDRFDDQRKFRRKANLVRLQARNMKFRLVLLQREIKHITANGAYDVGTSGENLVAVSKALKQEDVHNLLVAATNVRKAAETELEFGDLVDTDEDFKHADALTSSFEFFADFFKNREADFDDEQGTRRKASLVLLHSVRRSLETHIPRVEAAEDHFRRRAQGII